MKQGSLYLWVNIYGAENARELWDKIKPYDVNLTEVGDTSYVYGEVTMETAVKIIGYCEQHGKTEVNLSMVGRK